MDKLNVLGDKAEDRGLRGLYVLVTVNGEGIVADSRDLREDFKRLPIDRQLSVAKCFHAYLANLFAQLDGVGTDICRFLGSVPQEWNRHFCQFMCEGMVQYGGPFMGILCARTTRPSTSKLPLRPCHVSMLLQ